MRLISIGLLTMALLWSGCFKPVIIAPTGIEEMSKPVGKESIAFTTRASMQPGMKEIAYVYAQGISIPNAIDLAKEKAGEKGGNAIINGRVSTQSILAGYFLFFPIYQKVFFAEGIVVRTQDGK